MVIPSAILHRSGISVLRPFFKINPNTSRRTVIYRPWVCVVRISRLTPPRDNSIRPYIDLEIQISILPIQIFRNNLAVRICVIIVGIRYIDNFLRNILQPHSLIVRINICRNKCPCVRRRPAIRPGLDIYTRVRLCSIRQQCRAAVRTIRMRRYLWPDRAAYCVCVDFAMRRRRFTGIINRYRPVRYVHVRCYRYVYVRDIHRDRLA